MVSTLTILSVSVLSLFLAWRALRPGFPQVKSLEDWEAKKHEVDPDVFSIPPKNVFFAVHFLRMNSAPCKGGAWLWRCMPFGWQETMPQC